jgi:hypothetical protein
MYEMFFDYSYFLTWAVRPEGDRDFNSPNLHHFSTKAEAEAFMLLKNNELANQLLEETNTQDLDNGC